MLLERLLQEQISHIYHRTQIDFCYTIKMSTKQ